MLKNLLLNILIVGAVALITVGCDKNDKPAAPVTAPVEQVTTDIIASDHNNIEYGELANERCVDRKYVKSLTLAKQVKVWETVFPVSSKMTFGEKYSCEAEQILNLYLKTVEVPQGQFVTVPFRATTVKLEGVLEKSGSSLYGTLYEDILLSGQQFRKGDRIVITTIRF